MCDLGKLVCQPHLLQNAPGPGPDHDTSTNFLELARRFIQLNVEVGMLGERHGQAQTPYAPATSSLLVEEITQSPNGTAYQIAIRSRVAWSDLLCIDEEN